MRRRRSRGRRRRWWLSNNRRRNAFKDRHQMLAGAFSQHGIKSFLLFLFAFFIIFNIFFSTMKTLMLSLFDIFFWRGQFLCRAAQIYPQMRIYSTEIHWEHIERKSEQCAKGKRMNVTHQKMTVCLKEILKWIAQHCGDCTELYLLALCAGEEFFISYIIYSLLQWFCKIRSIPLAHTKRNTQNSHC